MKERTACFTGHRAIPLLQRGKIEKQTEDELIEAIEKGYQFFATGGALGYDTLAAQTVLRLKKSYSHIKLILVLPCLSQTRGWKPEDIAEYERIKAAADEVVYTAQKYSRDCMFKRNRHLVDNSSLCIAYLTRNSGGTAYTVNYAKSKGLIIRNVAT